MTTRAPSARSKPFWCALRDDVVLAASCALRRARCGFTHRKSAGRAEYLRVRTVTAPDGEPEMHLHGRKGAGVLSSLTGADGLLEIPVENTGVAVGDWLPFMPFRETGL